MIHELIGKRNNIHQKEKRVNNTFIIINTALITIVIFLICLLFIYYLSEGRFANLNQIEGEWFNKQFIEELERTKSIRKSYNVDNNTLYTAFNISRKDPSYFNWDRSYRYHEGDLLTITRIVPLADPNIYLILFHKEQTHSPITSQDRFLIKKSLNEIVWIFNPLYSSSNSEQRVTFVRLEPSIEEYINNIIIAGKYTDENGRIFEFNKSGDAIWPEKVFKYQVGLDTYWAEGKFDYFVVEGEKFQGIYPMRYGFEWVDNKLLIYEIAEVNFLTQVSRKLKPLYILTPEK
ncbi:hypothetical protein ACFL6K_04180 [Candidatus Latescibacterota bacterium]